MPQPLARRGRASDVSRATVAPDAPTDAPASPTAHEYVERLTGYASPVERAKVRRSFKAGGGEDAGDDVFLGVRMGRVFELSKAFREMPLGEIERLLESPIREVRAGGVKIMAYQAAARSTPARRRKELFELYLRRHDRIDNWDLVDLGAWDVVGRYLVDQRRDALYDLAASSIVWERRTAILATLFFVRRGDLDDTFRIAERLVHDPHDLVQKAVGGALREAGKRDRGRLLAFLDGHAATMPRTALRYAIEHLDPDERARYLSRRTASRPAPPVPRRGPGPGGA
jgi:3-methyladenine DNA glycosylase AlkD